MNQDFFSFNQEVYLGYVNETNPSHFQPERKFSFKYFQLNEFGYFTST